VSTKAIKEVSETTTKILRSLSICDDVNCEADELGWRDIYKKQQRAP
jgi:hypothetical protein